MLPNAGLTFKLTDDISTFASYAKGFSAPRTDNLYRQPIVTVTPETTDAFDLGVRYTTGKVQAQATGWFIQYQNRIVAPLAQSSIALTQCGWWTKRPVQWQLTGKHSEGHSHWAATEAS